MTGNGNSATERADTESVVRAFRDSDNIRLRRALVSLDAALKAQREAVAAWRASLATLATTVSGIGSGLKAIDANLTCVTMDLSDVGDLSRSTVETIDSAMKRHTQ